MDCSSKKYNYLLLSVFICLLLFILQCDNSIVPASVHFTIVPLILSSFALVYADRNLFSYFKCDDKSRAFFCSALSILLFLMLNPFELKASGFFSISFSGMTNILSSFIRLVIYPLCVFMAVYILLTITFDFNFNSYKKLHPSYDRENSPLFFGVYPQTVIVLLFSLFFMLAARPWWRHPDSDTVWAWITTGDWREWHTLGYLYFVKLCSLLRNSPYSVTVVQTFLWVFINNKNIGILNRYTCSKKVCNIYLILSLIFFTPFLFLQYMFKDVVFSMFVLAFSVSVFDFLSKDNHTYLDYLLIGTFGLLFSLFRHSSLVPLLVTLIALAIYYVLHNKKFTAKLAVLFIIPLGGYFLLVNVLGMAVLKPVPNPPYIKYTVPIYMIGSFVYNDIYLDNATQESIYDILPKEKWENSFDKYFADSLSREWGEIGDDVIVFEKPQVLKKLIPINAKMFMQRPVEYVQNLSNITSLLWEIGRPMDGYELLLLENVSRDYPFAVSGVNTSAATDISYSTANAIYHMPILSPFYFRGGFWVFILITCACLFAYKRQFKFIICLLPTITITALLLLSIPAQDPRYILSIIECGLIFFVIAVTTPSKRNVDKVSLHD